jgi:hypothetical protein
MRHYKLTYAILITVAIVLIIIYEIITNKGG